MLCLQRHKGFRIETVRALNPTLPPSPLARPWAG